MSNNSNRVVIHKKSDQELVLNDFSNLKISSGTETKTKTILTTKSSIQYKVCDDAFKIIETQINSLGFSEKNKNIVYSILKDFVDNFANLTNELISDSKIHEQCVTIFKEKINTARNYIQTSIRSVSTSYKRKENLKKCTNFVKPKELAIGLKWHTKQNILTNLPDHTIKQLTFQYVSILQTLKCLFKQAEFKRKYFEYNSNETHSCKDGVYERFCCSKTHKKCKLYDNKNAIKIRIAVDDCDVCDPIKSKSVIHKLNCVYFTIDNMPEKYLSKTDNLFLVSLCETTNLKEDDNTFDEIGKLILNELKELENTGIEVDGHMIQGGLARFLSDNLGANQCLGLVESFNSFFCRLCEVSKEESTNLVKEQPELMRTKENYQLRVQIAANFVARDKPIEFKETKGVKRACIFNELQTFHLIDNPTLDVMHDVNEGLIPFLLENFFKYCDSKNIVKKSEIKRLVRDYNYGLLGKRNKPSLLNFDRTNLGQNAKQLYFIMIHMPFIFVKYKEKLKNVWIAVETLLKSMQIIYSYKICEDDIRNLSSYIENHYITILNIFDVKLLPKHHNVLHYPNAISKMGPLMNSWMMRFEAKHQFFTTAARETNNFINIAKTLAEKHQEIFSHKNFAFDTIEPSKTHNTFHQCKYYANFDRKIKELVGEENYTNLVGLKFVKFNAFEFRNGLMIISNNTVYEIDQILSCFDRIILLCHSYNVNKYCSFHNSIEIEPKSVADANFEIFELNHIQNPRTYERKVSENKFFIICDSLDFKEMI